jgi:hypothetical protein
MAEILNIWQIWGKFFNVELKKKEIATILGADSKSQTDRKADRQADRLIWSLRKGT